MSVLPLIAPRFGIQDKSDFGRRATPSSQLPDPQPLLENLTRCVIEILAGVRDLSQISCWVAEDVYRRLLKHTVLAAQGRHRSGERIARPNFVIARVAICEPDDGVVEAVVIVRGRARVRAVALRLEGLDGRWRATTIRVL